MIRNANLPRNTEYVFGKILSFVNKYVSGCLVNLGASYKFVNLFYEYSGREKRAN